MSGAGDAGHPASVFDYSLHTSLCNKAHTGRPSSSTNATSKTKGEELICTDRPISLDDIANELNISHGSAHNLVKSLGVFKCLRSFGT